MLRRVAALKLGYFGIEFALAVAIGSVALFADSNDVRASAAIITAGMVTAYLRPSAWPDLIVGLALRP